MNYVALSWYSNYLHYLQSLKKAFEDFLNRVGNADSWKTSKLLDPKKFNLPISVLRWILECCLDDGLVLVEFSGGPLLDHLLKCVVCGCCLLFLLIRPRSCGRRERTFIFSRKSGAMGAVQYVLGKLMLIYGNSTESESGLLFGWGWCVLSLVLGNISSGSSLICPKSSSSRWIPSLSYCAVFSTWFALIHQSWTCSKLYSLQREY